MIITDNTSHTTTVAAGAIASAMVYGTRITVDSTMLVRLSHAAVNIVESSRKLQVLGAINIGLAFYNSLVSIIAQPVFALQNFINPDTTQVPADAMGLYGNHPEFMALADMVFNAGAVPAYVAPFASVQVKNNDTAAHDIVLTIISVVERK